MIYQAYKIIIHDNKFSASFVFDLVLNFVAEQSDIKSFLPEWKLSFCKEHDS